MSKLHVTVDGESFEIELHVDVSDPTRYTAVVDGEIVQVNAPASGGNPLLDWVLIDERPYELVFDPELHWVKAWSGRHTLTIRDTKASFSRPPSGDARVKAPIPGLITSIRANKGDKVAMGQPLLVLEAMKMENEIRAPRAGVLCAIHVQVGQTVGMGDMLLEIE